MTNKKDSRRKLLKSFAAGSGAVVAGKSLPESWSKPVIDAVVLPSHASTTDDTGSGGPEATTTCPDGALKCAADPIQFVRFYNNRSGVVSSSYDVTATVCPPVAGVSVTLALNGVAVDNAKDASGQAYGPKLSPQLTDTSGVATFSEVSLQFKAIESGTASARLDLVFSAGTDECMLSLPFTETNMNGNGL